MNEQAASLLHAIRETPDDDTPRLILADWFEDNGDPLRAEFIRAQVRLAGDPTPEERRSLRAREKFLIETQSRRWLGALGENPWVGASFDRGMTTVSIPPSKLMSAKTQKQAEVCFGPALVTQLQTIGTTSRWAAFAEMPLLEEVCSLKLSMSKLELAGIEALARSPRLRYLRSLAIRDSASPYYGLGGPGMKALGESPHLVGLTGLDFCNYPLDHHALTRLINDPRWANLTSLNLDKTPRFLTNDEPLNSPWVTRLTHLSLYNCMGIDAVVQRCVHALSRTRLRYLGLGNNNVGDGGATTIATSAHLGELRELWLNFPEFTEIGAKALADSPHLGKLQILYIYGMKPDAAPANILRERFGDVVQAEWSPRG